MARTYHTFSDAIVAMQVRKARNMNHAAVTQKQRGFKLNSRMQFCLAKHYLAEARTLQQMNRPSGPSITIEIAEPIE